MGSGRGGVSFSMDKRHLLVFAILMFDRLISLNEATQIIKGCRFRRHSSSYATLAVAKKNWRSYLSKITLNDGTSINCN